MLKTLHLKTIKHFQLKIHFNFTLKLTKPLYQFQTYNLGTLWCFDFYSPNFSQQFYQELEKKLISKIQKFNSQYSRFESTSFVGILNRDKKIKKASLDLFKMLQFGQLMFDFTKQNFDITIATELEKKGYDVSFDKIQQNLSNPNKQNVLINNFDSELLDFSKFKISTKKQVSYTKENNFNLKNNSHKLSLKELQLAKSSKYGFYLDSKTKQVLLDPDKKIDLGGLGKGYLVDKLARFLKNQKVLNFSINAGGDIFNTNLRKFYLQSPVKNNFFIGQIEIQNQAIAASNPLYRNWQKKGKKQNHFIQKTNFQNQVMGIYLKAKNCLLADSLATALFVSPPEVQLDMYKNPAVDFEFMMIFKDNSFFESKGYSRLTI